jgi:hypothetical protein
LRDVLSSYYNMKTKTIVSLLAIIGFILAVIILTPIINKWIQVNKIEKLQKEYARCEMVLQDTHTEADKIRENLGLISEQEQPQRTWTEAPELTWYIIE